jgi:molecular chaperone DnaK (HSP70)
MSARKPTPSVPEAILVLDLGSASLRAALIVDGRPHVISLPTEGGRVPTIVGFDTSRINSAEDILVLGDDARRLAITEPRTQVFGALRLAGRRHELAELDDDRWRQVRVERGPGGDVHFCLAGSTWPVPRLLGALLQSIVEQIQRSRGLRFERAVVSVAPGSDDARRRAILHALQVAGLDEIDLVHGTTAAALAWSTLEREGAAALGIAGLEAALQRAERSEESDEETEADANAGTDADPDTDPDPDEATSDEDNGDEGTEDIEDESEPEPAESQEQLVLLLDLGAASFDAALARVEPGQLEIVAARSRLDLGGEDIDERIVDWLLGQFEDANEVDLSGDATVRARMRDVAEKAKRALSDDEQHEVRLPFLWADASGPKHLFVTLERARFERMIHDIVEGAASLASAVLADAGSDADELDAIVMLGGSARVPVIQDRIEALLGRVPETELSTAALDEDFLVRGLALEAWRRSQRRPQLRAIDIAGRELWLGEREGAAAPPRRVIERGTPRPLMRSVSLALSPVSDGELPRAEVSVFEGDDDDRALALRAELRGEASEAELQLELDADGCLVLAADPPSVELTLSQRIGLSPRALARLRREARDRARAAATEHRNQELRRRLRTSIRTNEAWLGDEKAGLDELLRTSLMQWGREAEAALELASDDLLLAARESFAGLCEALPPKLREQLEDEPLDDYPELDDDAEVEELGDSSTDYAAHERVAPLELHRVEDEVEVEAEVEADLDEDDQPEPEPEPMSDDDSEPELAHDDDQPEPEPATSDDDDQPEPELATSDDDQPEPELATSDDDDQPEPEPATSDDDDQPEPATSDDDDQPEPATSDDDSEPEPEPEPATSDDDQPEPEPPTSDDDSEPELAQDEAAPQPEPSDPTSDDSESAAE